MCANCETLRDELVFVQQRYLALLAAAQDDSPQPVALSVKVSEYQRLTQELAEMREANAELLRGVHEHRTDKNVIARLERKLADAQRTLADWRTCCETARRERDEWKTAATEHLIQVAEAKNQRDAVVQTYANAEKVWQETFAEHQARRCGNCAWKLNGVCRNEGAHEVYRRGVSADFGCVYWRAKDGAA
jgi:hypothetical protein